MSKLKGFMTSCIVPLIIVFAISVPFFIVLRLYPTLLKFEVNNVTINAQFASLFFSMLFLGTLIALLHNFIVAPLYMILASLAVEAILFASIIFIGKPIIVKILLIFLGISIGILQTCITVFFGDRYTSELFYSQLHHFHVYLLGQFAAYFVSIWLTPLYYAIPEYGICRSSVNLPLSIAIVCIVFAGVLLVIIYFRSLNRRTSSLHAIPAAFTKMRTTLIIFIPLLFLWMLAFLSDYFLILQSQNVYTKLHSHQLEFCRAAIIVACIPICCFLNLNAFPSIYMGDIRMEPYRNFTVPHNYTIFYSCYSDPSLHQMYKITDVVMETMKNGCYGPVLIRIGALNNETFIYAGDFYRDSNEPKYRRSYHFKEYPKSPAIVLVEKKIFNLDEKVPFALMGLPERTFRSLSTLPLIRIHSYFISAFAKNWRQFERIWIVGGEPSINISIPMNMSYIMEVPPGKYAIRFYYSANNRITNVYFRPGGYYNIFMGEKIINKYRIRGYERNTIFEILVPFTLSSLGKILILSSGLNIVYTASERDIKCALIGIFWGIYYFAHIIFYWRFRYLRGVFDRNMSGIFIYMLAAIGVYRVLYCLEAYKLTDTIIPLDDNIFPSNDNENDKISTTNAQSISTTNVKSSNEN